MSLLVVGSELVPLARWVYVVVKASEECVREPLLAKLSCRDGPVADDIQDKIAAPLRGEPGQTVAIVVEEQTDTPPCCGERVSGWTPKTVGVPRGVHQTDR